jgi:hypothetical protein
MRTPGPSRPDLTTCCRTEGPMHRSRPGREPLARIPEQPCREATKEALRACRKVPVTECLPAGWGRRKALRLRLWAWATVRALTGAPCPGTARHPRKATVTATPARWTGTVTVRAVSILRAESARRYRKDPAWAPEPQMPRRQARERPLGQLRWCRCHRTWCPEPGRETQRVMQEHLRKGLVPLRAPLLPCRAEDPHGIQSAFEFLRTSD